MDKLMASNKSTIEQPFEDLGSKSMSELQRIMYDKEREEVEGVDRVGRRLDSMLEAVKVAKNVARPVQVALHEAIEALRMATKARKWKQTVRDMIHKKKDEEGPTEAGAHTSNTHNQGADSILRDIVQELKNLRKDVKDIQSAQGESNSTGDGVTWTEVVKKGKSKKPSAKEENANRTESSAATRQTPKSVEGVYPPRKKPPAIIVRLNDGGYSEALKKLKGSDQVKAASENIVGLTKTRNGDLLIRVKAASETPTKLMDAVGTAMGDRSAVMELVQYQKIVVQDLDEIAENEEIIGAIRSLANTTAKEIRVVSTLLQARGQKWPLCHSLQLWQRRYYRLVN